MSEKYTDLLPQRKKKKKNKNMETYRVNDVNVAAYKVNEKPYYKKSDYVYFNNKNTINNNNNLNNNNDKLVFEIINFLKTHNVKIDDNFSVIVNQGPGSFSSIRISLAVAKGLEISKKVQLYGYNNEDLREFTLENRNKLLKSKLLEKKLIN